MSTASPSSRLPLPAVAVAAAGRATDAVAYLQAVPARRNRKQQQANSPLCDCGSGSTSGCAYYAAGAADPHRLLSFDDAPPALRFNRYIRSGYRAGLTPAACLCSALRLHNETANIWTHALPALGMLAALASGSWVAWPQAAAAFALNVGSILLCFLLSAGYHSFMAHHHQYSSLLCADVLGILGVLVGGGHVVLGWGLRCVHPVLRSTLCAAYFGAGAAATFAAVRASSPVNRALPMLALLLIRLAALAARGALAPAAQGIDSAALRWYVAMEVCSLLGGIINAARVPERFFQPKARSGERAPLDLWLNSHNIMHVLVAGAMACLHLGAASDYRAMQESGCAVV